MVLKRQDQQSIKEASNQVICKFGIIPAARVLVIHFGSLKCFARFPRFSPLSSEAHW